ncbi:MAG: MFS transporter [Sphingomonadales bacterium]
MGERVTREASETGPPAGGAATRRARLGWALFDWANQPYFTLITTFIFAPYFATAVIGDAVRGQTLWSYAQSVAGLLIALAAPVAGAIGDARGPRKPWIAGCTVIAMAAMGALWFAVPGAPGSAVPVLSAVVIAALAVEIAIVFNNAMLPGLATASHIGRLSGFGWGLGYVGGLVALLIVAFVFAQPWFGLDAPRHEPARLTGPFSALWLGLFVIPLFLYTPDQARALRKIPPGGAPPRKGLVEAVRAVLRHRNIAVFLIGRMLYFDGLSAIYAFGGIYAAGIFGWETRTLGLFGIVLIVFSMIGAFAGGWFDDRMGSKRTIILGLLGVILGTLGILSISSGEVFFVFDLDPVAPGNGLFATAAERFMLVFSALVGICGGPVQAASRTLLARLAPHRERAKYFGLYAMSGKATAFLAPLLVGIFTTLFHSQRAGLAVIVVFLVAGLAILTRVSEERP